MKRRTFTQGLMALSLAPVVEPNDELDPEAWSQSDLNSVLIAIALAHATGMSCESLLQKRIAKPLMLSQTGTNDLGWRAERRARPHPDELALQVLGG